ncbi:menaquinol-cytochrome c reductase cytochrome b/c subunit [Longirhabdus pacifica]|uniref:menaquinol-cytochrome c reductase cytochrome b/c subunit n=1 Tax=Longirhabdus pacifica TaxID=2305227 RepID=UPI0010089D3E|nr:menaquinol-cytochrome c reductase cytochrome b/c subunit [Longirhabdus pacifica]
MAHDHHSKDEKVIYVGDSRVKQGGKFVPPPDYSAYPGKSEAFIPNFLLKEWMVGCVVLIGFLALIIAHPSPLGYPADPNNSAFIPMPDWYFLFMYQLLKYPYLSEDYVVFGTVIIPGLLFGALTLAPFLDTGKERRFYKRPIASSLMLLSFAAVVYLTVVSWDHYQHELEINNIIPEHIERAEKLAAGEDVREEEEETVIPIVGQSEVGYEIYEASSCLSCHASGLEGQASFPPLLGIGDKYTEDELVDIMKNGIGTMPAQWDSNITNGLTEDELNTLAAWLATQKAPAEDAASAE